MAQPVVSVIAADRSAYENPAFPEWGIETAEAPSRKAAFQVWRVGSIARPLTVRYAVTGTASNGFDYVALPGEVTIPAGSRFARIIVHPIDDTARETFLNGSNSVISESVIIAIRPSSAYVTGLQSRAKMSIFDDEAPIIVYVAHRGGSVGSVSIVREFQPISRDHYVVFPDYRRTNDYPDLPERQR